MQFSSLVLADVEPENSPKRLSDKAWEVNLRNQNFQDREIVEGEGDLVEEEVAS